MFREDAVLRTYVSSFEPERFEISILSLRSLPQNASAFKSVGWGLTIVKMFAIAMNGDFLAAFRVDYRADMLADV